MLLTTGRDFYQHLVQPSYCYYQEGSTNKQEPFFHHLILGFLSSKNTFDVKGARFLRHVIKIKKVERFSAIEMQCLPDEASERVVNKC